MTKKIISLLLLMGILFAFAACGKDDGVPKDDPNAVALTDAELLDAMANPENYIGRFVEFGGIINRFDNASYDYMFAEFQPFLPDSENVVHLCFYDGIEMLSDDYYEIRGIIRETQEIHLENGQEITAVIDVVNYEIKEAQQKYIDVYAPATKTIEVGESKTASFCTIEIEKIELSEKETRVYTKLRNTADETVEKDYIVIDVSIESMTQIIQDGKPYNKEDNNIFYQSINAAALRGDTQQGILVFPKISENMDFEVVFHAYIGEKLVELKFPIVV